jgi:predicted Rossmann fold nucleotide-binding protein DprA/Smf involved in DNA uptake
MWNQLSRTPLHIDELMRATNLSTQKTSSTLTLLEMKGAARHHGGQFYTRAA